MIMFSKLNKSKEEQIDQLYCVFQMLDVSVVTQYKSIPHALMIVP